MISSHAKPWANAMIPARRNANFSFEIKSVLVTTANFLARGCLAISCAIKISPAPDVSSAGMHMMTTSTESMLWSTTAFKR
ncbi:unannotated protein [freshwater metagenome]|uniref:Unannotated protein n=1 Tax=freshwater metagenome TaxID=449393 RepID=A0A6J6UBN9_9ZZZZ